MKQGIVFLLTTMTLLWECHAQTTDKGLMTYNGLPLLKAKTALADYRTGSDWVKGNWTISPHIEFDSLLITCHAGREVFGFYTDMDSIVLILKPGEVHQFYVALNDTAYALTVLKGVQADFKALQFDANSNMDHLGIWYEQNNDNVYLNQLRTDYAIQSLIEGAETDTEKVSKILHWVHNQWNHNGDNEPRKRDAISILEEVKEGKNFRCVEYAIVASACFNAVGLKARTLALKTKDVETRPYGAGHVLTEVYLNDLKKWVVIDGQWDAMPVLNGVPLNAVEFQKAIANNYKELEIQSLSDISKRHYVDWIHPYLYYFDISFDNREGIKSDRNKINGKSHLMLVPLGAPEPTVFQIEHPIVHCLYTHSLVDFYAAPNN